MAKPSPRRLMHCSARQAHFGAVEAGAITRNLEQLGERNDFTNATAVLAELRRAIEAMNIVMTSYEAAVV